MADPSADGTKIRQKLFDEANFNEDGYQQLKSLLPKLVQEKTTSKEFVKQFARKCYKTQYKNNKTEAKQQAADFLTLLFGSIDMLLRLGPDNALQQKCNLIAKRSNKKKIGDYIILNDLGEGGQATVKLGRDVRTNKPVAVKIYRPEAFNEASFQKEVKVLKGLDHPNIVKLLDFFPSAMYNGKPRKVAVIEFCSCGEVIEYLSHIGHFDEPLARWMLKELVKAVDYCHSRGICHRDLKHDNCLFGENFQLKITDFGFATAYNVKQKMKTFVGTPEYAAPEIIENIPYTDSVDIFSMGVMLFVALTRSRPFKKASVYDPKYKHVLKKTYTEFWKIHNKSNPLARKLSNEAKHLITGMISSDPTKRFTLKDVKKHPWLLGTAYTQKEAADFIQTKRAEKQKKLFDSMGRRGEKSDRATKQDPIEAKYQTGDGTYAVEILGRGEKEDTWRVKYLEGEIPDPDAEPSDNPEEKKTIKLENVVWDSCPEDKMTFPKDLAPEYPFDQPAAGLWFYSDSTPSSILEDLTNYFEGTTLSEHDKKKMEPNKPEAKEDDKEELSNTQIDIFAGYQYEMFFSMLWVEEDEKDDEESDAKEGGDDGDDVDDADDGDDGDDKGETDNKDEEDVDEEVVEGKIEIYRKYSNPGVSIVIFKRQRWREKGVCHPIYFSKVYDMTLKANNTLMIPDENANA